jgi:hypothetical protein
MRERPPLTLDVVLPDAYDILDQTNQSIDKFHCRYGVHFHKIGREYLQSGVGTRGGISQVYSDNESIPENVVIESEYAEGEFVGSTSGYDGYHTHEQPDGYVYKIPVIYKKRT